MEREKEDRIPNKSSNCSQRYYSSTNFYASLHIRLHNTFTIIHISM